MTVEMDETKLVRETLNASRMLLTILSANFENPVDAYVALVVTLASMSHGMGIDLEHTLSGVSSAYKDIETKKGRVMQ